MNIAKSIKLALIHTDMEQKELARRMGVTKQFVSGLSTGSRPASINMVKRLAEALEYKVSDFIALGEEEKAA